MDFRDFDAMQRIHIGAVNGVLTVKDFDLNGYLMAELAEVTQAEHGEWLGELVAAGVFQHAGTLRRVEAADEMLAILEETERKNGNG